MSTEKDDQRIGAQPLVPQEASVPPNVSRAPDPKRSIGVRIRRAVRAVLCMLAIIGMWRAIAANGRATQLQAELQRLNRTFGDMTIKDPNKAYVLLLPQEEKLVWKFRVYFPMNYAASETRYFGRISAATPRSALTSGGSSSIGPFDRPMEFLMTVAAYNDGGGWEIHTSTINARGTIGLGSDFAKLLDQPDSLVIECAGASGAAEFAVDQPICLLRFRGSEPIDDVQSADPLYQGFHLYIVPKLAAQKFQQQQTQQTSPK
jgi:hypothetical protein